MQHGKGEINNMANNSPLSGNSIYAKSLCIVNVIMPKSGPEKISQQLDNLAINSIDQLNDAIEACKSLLKCLHNGAALTAIPTFHDPCAKILVLLNAEYENPGYQQLLKNTFDAVNQLFHWYSLFKGSSVGPHQLKVVNAPSLHSYYVRGAFTIEQLSTVTPRQLVNIFDRDVLATLANRTLTFDRAMTLSYHERELLSQSRQNLSLSK